MIKRSTKSLIASLKWVALEVCYAIFPLMRGLYQRLGFEFDARDFKQGKLKDEITIEDFKEYLHELGFERNRLAWICKNEVLNLRKKLKDGTQYHIRVFKDRTVKGHHEWAPEFAPRWHWYQRMLKPKRKHFRRMLGQFIIFK